MSTLSLSHPATAPGFETSFVINGYRRSWPITTCTVIAASGPQSIGIADAFWAGFSLHHVRKHRTKPCSDIACTASRGDEASPQREVALSWSEPLLPAPRALSP